MKNGMTARLLLYFIRHRIPVLSPLMRVVYNCDIFCRIPSDLRLPHPYGIVIHSKTHIGGGVTILHQVTIGGKDESDSASGGSATIGDGVTIGAGAKIIGGVRIGPNSVIGANAVVTKDVPASTVVVGFNQHRPRSA